VALRRVPRKTPQRWREALSSQTLTGTNYSLDFTQTRPAAVQDKIAQGMKQADENADKKWKHVFDGCVLAAARKKKEITSDDVLAEIEALPNPPDTHNLAAIGPAMQRASKMGILKHTDRVKRSERPEKHGNRQNIWESKFYEAKK
jgi:hypothetical protein